MELVAKHSAPHKSAGEQTPLVTESARPPLQKAPAWAFWRTLSSTHRFYLLLLMSAIPFGGHFVKVRLVGACCMHRRWRQRI